ncbi:MAG: glycosyltransferase [bacterium]
MKQARPKIAFWFRYGPGEHTELLHALPDVIAGLAHHCDVHYFGLRSRKPVPARIAEHATVHLLPFTVDRTSQRDKVIKTLLWICCLPYVGLKSRALGINAVYIDETIPLTTLMARIFFGRKVAVTVVDFFVDIYFGKPGLLQRFGRLIRAIDMKTWRTLPLVFTRAKSTKQYLVEQGLQADRIFPVYDPCDLSIYRPTDRLAAKEKFGWDDRNVVLVHHGILHPNKGNDRILRAIKPVCAQQPGFRYLLVGDGPEMDRLKALTRELGLESAVHFTGWLKTLEEVNTALNAGDIGLVMRVGAESDNFHLTGALVHSLACGLAVLGARLRGVSEVICEGENGLLFPPDDMTMFQDKLTALIKDRALRERLGRAGLDTARDAFDMERMTGRQIAPLLHLVRM